MLDNSLKTGVHVTQGIPCADEHKQVSALRTFNSAKLGLGFSSNFSCPSLTNRLTWRVAKNAKQTGINKRTTTPTAMPTGHLCVCFKLHMYVNACGCVHKCACLQAFVHPKG